MKQIFYLLIACLLVTYSCKQRSITLVKGIVLDNNKNPLTGVEINAIVNNVQVSHDLSIEVFDSLINADGMVKVFKPIITDSTGNFQFGFDEKYFLSQPKIQLSFRKERLKDTLVTLNSGQANLNVVVHMRAIKN